MEPYIATIFLERIMEVVICLGDIWSAKNPPYFGEYFKDKRLVLTFRKQNKHVPNE